MGSLILVLGACLPPILGDTGLPLSSGAGDSADGDTSETGSADDKDGDGFTSIDAGGQDCDDGNAEIHPGAPEYFNTFDENCDGLLSGRVGEFAGVQISADDAGLGAAASLHTCRGNTPGYVALGYPWASYAAVAHSADLLAGGFTLGSVRVGIRSDIAETQMGYSMDVQDFTGNGDPDFVVGALMSGDEAGAAYVVTDRAWGRGFIDVDGTLPSGVTVIEPPLDVGNAHVGIAVAANAAGIAVGATGNLVGGAWLFGPSALPDGHVDLSTGIRIRDRALDGTFGAAIGTLALGADGEPWLAVGAPGTDGRRSGDGRVYAWSSDDLGGSLGATTDDADVVVDGGQDQLNFGSAMGDPGDLDRDGYPDPMVVAYNSTGGGRSLFVIDGSRLGPSVAAVDIMLSRVDELSPYFDSLMDFTWGDFNGDTLTDVAVSRSTEEGGEVRIIPNFELIQGTAVILDDSTPFVLGNEPGDGFGVGLAALDDEGGAAILASAPLAAPRPSLFAIPTHP